MTLSSGSRIGFYELLDKLGEGGMGEVYRARDTRLKRDVAIKILPNAFSQDPDRISRFQREAEVLASLNHSNIAVIHGMEESGTLRCLVLELVEGETLAERIRRGPLPIEDALPIARQIAEAVEAAHQQGIVHRDLKPANIKLTPDGKVKVLDFGLAKIFERDRSPQELSHSPTIVSGTGTGVLIGTAAYMSPEQVRGQNADRSSDIWAFGCVLYEMLSGKKPFAGEVIADIIGSIVKVDPDWSALPESTPPILRSLLRRCLRKDRNRRVHDMGDVRIEIEDTLAPAGAGLEMSPVRALPGRREGFAWILAAFFLIASVVLLLPRDWFSNPETSSPAYFEIPMPRDTSPGPPVVAPLPTISPDGRHLAFVAFTGSVPYLWLRDLNSLSAEMRQDTDRLTGFPFWSRDSRYIGFFKRGSLFKIAIAGGPAQLLVEASGASSGTWNRDDVILFDAADSIHRISAAGGVSTVILGPDKSKQEIRYRFPYFLPNGKDFLFLVESAAAGKTEIRAASLDGGVVTSLVNVNSRAVYSLAGYLLFHRAGTLMAQPFDAESLTLHGEMIPIAEDLPFSTFGAVPFSVSDDGTLAYRSRAGGGETELVWFDRAGREIGTEPWEGRNLNPRLSPDGTRIAIERWDSNGSDIWVRDLNRGAMTRLTSDPADDQWPIWSPDGKSIAFVSNRGKPDLYQRSASGLGSDEPLNAPSPSASVDWFSGGILFNTNEGDIAVQPVTGDRKAHVLIGGPFNQRGAKLSPEGTFIAYTSNESGRDEIYVQTFPLSDKRWPVSLEGGVYVFWRADGKELFFDGGRMMMAVDVKPGPNFQPGIPRMLFEMPRFAGTRFVVSPDGQRFLIPVERVQSGPVTMTVVLNWPALLK
ncbi:MAG: protein kinase [Acidobacteria bacterium]|nr:protein kinase [Acidobacteriota bacterium]